MSDVKNKVNDDRGTIGANSGSPNCSSGLGGDHSPTLSLLGICECEMCCPPSQGHNENQLWRHEVRSCGPCCVSSISCGDREIGWHVQNDRAGCVFFVTGRDVLGWEVEKYREALVASGFKVEVVVGRERYRQFIEDTKEKLDPFFVMASSFV